MAQSSSGRQHRTNATEGKQALLSKEEFLRRLGKLADRWGSHHQADLHLRHDTGQLLHAYFGDPTTGRQPHGEQVMLKAAKKLGKTEAELSQLRRFAHYFTSTADLKRKHPTVTTWTAVRDLLTTLPKGTKGKKTRTRKTTPAKLRRITASVAALTKTLSKLKLLRPAQDEVDKLMTKLRELSQATPAWLPLQIVLNAKPKKKAK